MYACVKVKKLCGRICVLYQAIWKLSDSRDNPDTYIYDYICVRM